MKMKNVYILGPSHIHSDFTNIVSDDIKYGLIFNGCTLDGHCGIPNWSRYIYDKIKENYEINNDVVWIVSDFKFNNMDYEKNK
ncbi:hypothetical protein [Acetobacter aceti]|uniref:hypothetical protein n=1 Tax=Acetobacter aceti TaxID=435 RepID=UPI0011EA58E8|nr:hypothetical protein [Acetobacter aceti]